MAWTENTRRFGVRRADGVIVPADDEAEAISLWEASNKDWTLVSQVVVTRYESWEPW